MAKSSAERQREYRKRLKLGQSGPSLGTGDPGQGNRFMTLPVSVGVYFALRRLARHQNKSMQGVVAELIENADKAVTVGFDPDSLEWDQYMGSAVRRPVTK